MEYGIGIMISIKKWRRPSGSEEKVDPSTETGKKSHTQKRQPSKQIALQIDSPPKIEKQDVKRKKKARKQSLYASHTKQER